jgi:uncharacterized damage-inducible protein DinB
VTLEERKRLAELLNQTHESTRALVDGADLNLQVYETSGWRIRDILGHIATWDRQTVKSLSAYQSGADYFISSHDEDDFNEMEARRWGALSSQKVFDEWERARKEFTAAVEQVSTDLYPGDLMYPWGDERGTIAHLVELMVEHEIEHRDDIAAVLRVG